MSNEQREAIEAAIQIHDDGDGAPIGAVIQFVAQEFGIGPTLSRTLDLYQRGDLCSCGEGRIRVTPERNERLKADGGTVMDNYGAEAPEDVDGVDLMAAEECPVCLDRAAGFIEQPAGYYTCQHCFSTWAGDVHDAEIVCYYGPEVATDGGTGDLRPFGGEVPHIDDRDDPVTPDLRGREVRHEDPDPKTAHPDFLLGRTVEIDFGSNVREGEIRQVKDHAVQGRWISAKPDQGGMILADPEEHDIEFVDGDSDD